jgi:uncharacterized short protein YbdD (DUF466 family)
MSGSRTGGPADGRTDVTPEASTPFKAGSATGKVRNVFGKLSAILGKVAGMPDYQAYLQYLRHSHPDCAVPTEREYYAEFVRSRYEDGPTRCC